MGSWGALRTPCRGSQPCLLSASLLGVPYPHPEPEAPPSSHLHNKVKIIQGDFSTVCIFFFNMQVEVTENCCVLFNAFLRPPQASHTPAVSAVLGRVLSMTGEQSQGNTQDGSSGWDGEAGCHLTVRWDTPSSSPQGPEETHSCLVPPPHPLCMGQRQ